MSWIHTTYFWGIKTHLDISITKNIMLTLQWFRLARYSRFNLAIMLGLSDRLLADRNMSNYILISLVSYRIFVT